MPRIRKKTSKRVAIHQREKFKHKAKESRKKKAKEAKKNPQWKSKHKKDPGIPNNFPYKDQILAEVAEQRRIAEEAKQRRKDEKKAAKAAAEAGSDDEGEGEEGSDAGEGFDGIRAVLAARATADRADVKMVDAEAASEDEDEEVPVLLNPDLPNLQAVLAAADVLVEVLDARDPAASRSTHLEEVARGLGKPVVLVLSKIDVCPREAVEAWATALRQEYPTVLFRSASACLPISPNAVPTKGKGKGKARERADDAWGVDAVLTLLRSLSNSKPADAPLAIAIAGATNAGKTSFVNALLRKAALPTYRLATAAPDAPSTTTHPQEVSIDLEGGRTLRVIDTPGLAWLPVEDAAEDEVTRLRARDILVRNRGHIERLKDPAPVLSELVSRASREDLMLLYNLPIFTDGDANAFLAGVARANGFIKKKGDPDLANAARMVLRDWSNGKLMRYTMPPTPSASSSPASTSASAISAETLTAAYAKDESVLAKLSTRKDLRKAGGLVKLRAPLADTRKVALETSYFVAEDDEGMEGDEEDGGAVDDADDVGLPGDESDEDEDEGDEEEDEEDEDEEEDEEEEEDQLESSPPRGKRRRAPTKAPARPAKRVAFAPEPAGTKRARSAAGAKSKAPAKPSKAEATKKAKPSAAKKPAKAPAPPKKVANASSGKAKQATATQAKGGEAAYDFKQFF